MNLGHINYLSKALIKRKEGYSPLHTHLHLTTRYLKSLDANNSLIFIVFFCLRHFQGVTDPQTQ